MGNDSGILENTLEITVFHFINKPTEHHLKILMAKVELFIKTWGKKLNIQPKCVLIMHPSEKMEVPKISTKEINVSMWIN